MLRAELVPVTGVLMKTCDLINLEVLKGLILLSKSPCLRDSDAGLV